jgi:hypothetical protein
MNISMMEKAALSHSERRRAAAGRELGEESIIIVIKQLACLSGRKLGGWSSRRRSFGSWQPSCQQVRFRTVTTLRNPRVG